MKTANYKLAGDIPALLLGTEETVTVKEDGKDVQKTVRKPYVIKTPEAETLDEFQTGLVEDAKPENVLKLAQQQFDIIAQRKVREAANSEEIAGILAGKTVEIDGEKLDFSTATEQERIDHALAVLQQVADSFKYGARAMIAGSSQKRNAEVGKGIAEAAKSGALSAETMAELEKLGYKF